MKIHEAAFALTLAVGVGSLICSAQDFSADVVYLPGSKPGAAAASVDTSSHVPSKIYVSKDKIRLETRGPASTVLLVNGADQTAVALLPAKKEYEPLVQALPEYFPVTDAENACPDWQKAAAQKLDCEKVGQETVGGRKVVKYKTKSFSEDSVSTVWIDLSVKFVVKWESAAAGAELRNIQEASQPADLFTLPPDYEIARPRKGSNKGFTNRGR